MITVEDIEYIAKLSKLKLSNEEKERFVAQMGDIVEFANQVSSLDTDNVQAKNHILDLNNVFREDEVRESYSRDDILRNAPAKEAGCIVVPNMI